MEITEYMAGRTLSSPSSARCLPKLFITDIYQIFVKPKNELLPHSSSSGEKRRRAQHIIGFFNLSPDLTDAPTLMQRCLFWRSRQGSKPALTREQISAWN